MKRTISLILACILFVSAFASCAGVEETENTATEEQSETKAEETEVWPGKRITSVLTPEKLYSMKVVSNSMTEDEVRDLVLEFMTLENSVPWISGDNYYSDWSKNNRTFPKNTIYLGMPYGFHSGSLYTFVDFIDPETGVLYETKGTDFEHFFVNDCSDGFHWAWARVASSITFTTPKDMMEKKGVLKVGDYKWPQKDIQSLDDCDTYTVCDLNGREVIYKAYAKLKKADGLLVYKKDAGKYEDVVGNQHVLMIKDITVVRDSKGKIDPKQSFVSVMEQGNWTYDSKIDGQKAYDLATEGDGSTNTRTFEKLFDAGYVPITCAELNNPKLIKETSIETGLENGATLPIGEILKGVIKTSFRIANTKLTVYNEDGTVLKSRYYAGSPSNGTESRMFELPMEEAFRAFSVTGEKPLRIELEVTVSNGVRVTAFSGYVTAK